ncbi:MAG: DUF4097 family beta strand repeat-containing protein [Streptosporangiaceae bacterium]
MSPPPSSGRRAALAIGGILVALLIPYWGFHLLGWTSGGATRTTHQTYTQPVERVNAEIASGDVTVTRADGSAVVARERLRGSLWAPRVEKRLSGRVLTLRGHCGGPFQTQCDISVSIAVPEDVAVDLTTSSGDVSATGVAGPATLSTSSGDVESRDVGGPLTMTTSSGDVVGAGLHPARVTATTSSGDVKLGFVTRPRHVQGHTSSGDVTVEVPSGSQTYNVTADTHSGDREVRVRTDPASPRSIEARTSSGDVTVTTH